MLYISNGLLIEKPILGTQMLILTVFLVLNYGMMDGPNRRERPHREWTNAIRHWRGSILQDLSCSTLDNNLWKIIINKASGAYRHGPWLLLMIIMMLCTLIFSTSSMQMYYSF